MAKVFTAACLLAVLAAAAGADQLFLADGRSFTGTITEEKDSVLIEMPYGSLRFSRDEVLRIDRKDTPEEALAKKLAETAADDSDALVEVARWAAEHGLDRRAQELCAEVLRLRPDHAGARRQLGQTKVDNNWVGFDEAMELARSKLAAGRHDELLKDVLPGLKELAGDMTDADRLAVGELLGRTQLCAGKFADAAKTFADLGANANSPAAVRCAAIAEILNDNPDGMYVLAEPYPPTAGLLTPNETALQAGPACLAEPLVLQAALRDKAKGQIEAGGQLLSAGRMLEASDLAAARLKYTLALKAFDRADALKPRISYSYRLQIARRRIAGIRKEAEDAARKFDQAMEKLGRQELSDQAYRAMVLHLIARLEKVRENLKAILEVAKPHSAELVLEMRWAEVDLRKTEQMRQELSAEFDERR